MFFVIKSFVACNSYFYTTLYDVNFLSIYWDRFLKKKKNEHKFSGILACIKKFNLCVGNGVLSEHRWMRI